jgi:Domain of unknown function (DUF4034)
MKQAEQLFPALRTYPHCKSPLPAIPLVVVVMLLISACPNLAAGNCPLSASLNVKRYMPDPPIAGDLNADMKTDVHAGEKYDKAVQELLQQEKFAELDALAASARATKSRFSGGSWKLHGFYNALRGSSFTACGKATEAEWRTHLEKLKRWTSLRPQSITARVALAEAYVGYAWYIRGDRFADVVADKAWKPFKENIQLAKDTLDDASALPEKCPHWYLVMQQVGRAQGWGLEELTALLNQASSFEPLYYYYYREHAFTLQPRWYGEEGDAERFAEQTSARIGGQQGAIVYFEIAVTLNCTGCSETKAQFSRMSWEKIQQGYAAEEELYGTSIRKLNDFAHLAIRAEDRPVALKLFVRIGDNWDKTTWTAYSYFDSSRQWAWAIPEDLDKLSQASYAGRQTREGDQYYRQVESEFTKRYAAELKQCGETEKGDSEPFSVFIRLGKDGAAQEMKAWPPTRLSACFMPKVTKARFKAPPQPSYPVALGIETRPHAMSWGVTSELPDPGE